MNKGIYIIVGLLILYLVLLYNFPITVIIITVIFIYLWHGGDDRSERPDQWINGYTKKDGTDVEGHWRLKKRK